MGKVKAKLYNKIMRPFISTKCTCDFCGMYIRKNDGEIEYEIAKYGCKHLHIRCTSILQTYGRLDRYLSSDKVSKAGSYYKWLCGWHNFLSKYLLKNCVDNQVLEFFKVEERQYKGLISLKVDYSMSSLSELINELDKLRA